MNRRVLGASVGATVLNQDIYDRSATQKHRLGTRCVRGDRVFKYVKSTSDVTALGKGVWSAYHQDIMYAACPTASPIGTSEIYVTSGAADGIANDGVFAINSLEGGSLVIFHATGIARNYAIVSNNAAVSAGAITIKLDGEMPEAVVIGDIVEAMGSQYRIAWNAASGGHQRAFIGILMTLLTTTYPYGWAQTWGPCWISPQALVGTNDGTYDYNEVIFRHDGSLGIPTDNLGYEGTYAQHAGYVMTKNQAGTGQGAPFIMLECSR